MGKIIRKKIFPEYFKAVLSGEKNYELRVADFSAKKGDTLILCEWNPKKMEHTGREIKKKITWVGKTKHWKLNKKEDIEKYGFIVLGFK